ncbi:HAMP domain-containing sensor histidine kinase [Paenibacillus pini]|uniref:histidine kinase n=1 Tax=Paenibacillus pini JCM 16418 TaxID=1236976 RepID=W7YHD2_9BACL|nr:HAMP domain-containing sensor histidine kinase [Paenibacillus pini]GAF06993.1 sensor histidine kinase [Paenibacillus pini JCM 16418]
MNKLGRKLFISISLAVLFIFVIFVLLTNMFLPKYYIYKTKAKLGEAIETIVELPANNFIASIPQLEERYNLTIVYDSVQQKENDLNDSLLEQFSKKAVKLNKFWITKESLDKVEAGSRVNKIYDQGKLKSSFYTSFIRKDQRIIVIGVSMAYLSDTIQIINKFILYLAILSVLIIVMVIWIVSYRMTRPLKELGEVAKDISALHFRKAKVHTKDEIGELALSINTMSDKLSAAHDDLLRKNLSLRRFMSDITHELKTPISLIQAYAEGIEDGLDDGSYVQTILRQNESMTRLIDELLDFAKIERDILERNSFALKDLFYECVEKFQIELDSRQITLVTQDEIQGNPMIHADLDKIRIVFHNLLSNAVKYTADQRIQVSLKEQGSDLILHMSNGIHEDIEDVSQLWEPFYVLESSRHKERSGTGLGLAIVKSILDQHGYDYQLAVNEQVIHFYVYFKKNSSHTA